MRYKVYFSIVAFVLVLPIWAQSPTDAVKGELVPLNELKPLEISETV